MAECLALWDGLVYAIRRGWKKVLIEGDSKLIIDCVNKAASVPWSIQVLIQDISLVLLFVRRFM